MSRKINVVWAVLSVCAVAGLTGCSPTADLSLKFSPDQTDSYRSVSEVTKDFRFEQPTINKLREEQTKTLIDMTFTQAIDSVDADGNATATITIDGLMVEMTNKNEPKYAYDSTSEKDADSPMQKLLGQRYTIRIAPDGAVTVVDAAAARAAVKSGYENKIVRSILDDKNIIDRHSVPALPETNSSLKVRDTWTEVVASPPGLLAPKNYNKTYTLTAVETRDGVTVATVHMNAGEDVKTAEGNSMGVGGMGIFAKMFDNEDTYTGSMVVDVDSGTLLSMEETLVSTYLAQEMPEKGDPDKGPDVLTMQFTNRLLLEKLD